MTTDVISRKALNEISGAIMTILCDGKIREYQKRMKLIEPFDESLVGPASYDLRVGQRVLKSVRAKNEHLS